MLSAEDDEKTADKLTAEKRRSRKEWVVCILPDTGYSRTGKWADPSMVLDVASVARGWLSTSGGMLAQAVAGKLPGQSGPCADGAVVALAVAGRQTEVYLERDTSDAKSVPDGIRNRIGNRLYSSTACWTPEAVPCRTIVWSQMVVMMAGQVADAVQARELKLDKMFGPHPTPPKWTATIVLQPV